MVGAWCHLWPSWFRTSNRRRWEPGHGAVRVSRLTPRPTIPLRYEIRNRATRVPTAHVLMHSYPRWSFGRAKRMEWNCRLSFAFVFCFRPLLSSVAFVFWFRPLVSSSDFVFCFCLSILSCCWRGNSIWLGYRRVELGVFFLLRIAWLANDRRVSMTVSIDSQHSRHHDRSHTMGSGIGPGCVFSSGTDG